MSTTPASPALSLSILKCNLFLAFIIVYIASSSSFLIYFPTSSSSSLIVYLPTSPSSSSIVYLLTSSQSQPHPYLFWRSIVHFSIIYSLTPSSVDFHIFIHPCHASSVGLTAYSPHYAPFLSIYEHHASSVDLTIYSPPHVPFVSSRNAKFSAFYLITPFPTTKRSAPMAQT